ncbi:hypothetical protein FF38_13794 [Lucilia cuprina]|uniref:Uncharacterized protein n=1 Tax=Lucilia cuprina TaxID=7375 RepID=A0A0L0C9U1_LUCCU|nr:hypothetical protein FF38_13794 [Lucilia cuprina]
MLPVARANLDHICCICLLDVRPSMFTQKVYDVKEEKNMSKILKLTAHITILKNPMNQKYINEYCRKVCEICFLKTQYSYLFREKIMASTAAVKELLEGSELNDQDIERLQYFCRICLNRQKTKSNAKCLNMQHLKWIKDCSGIRFTSLIEMEKFRIKEGTNINEIAEINDAEFPHQLCANCLKKLTNVEEFRKSATQSFEYMISVMGDTSGPDEDLIIQGIKQFRENIIRKEVPQAQTVTVCETSTKQDSAILKNDDDIKNEQQENFYTDVLQIQIQDVETLTDSKDFSNTLQLKQEDAFEDVIDFPGDLPHYSDVGDDDADFTLDFDVNDASSDDYNDNDDNKFFRNTRANTSKQYDKERDNKLDNKNEENIENEGDSTNPKRRKRDKQSESPEDLFSNVQKSTRKAKKPKETETAQHQDNIENEVTKPKRPRNVKKSEGTKKEESSTKPKRLKKDKQLSVDSQDSNNEKRTRKSKTPKDTENPTSKNNSGDDGKKEKLECVECAKVFISAYTYKRHLKWVHSPQSSHKTFTCELCLKVFRRKDHLNDHVKTVHEKVRAFKCSHCEKTFATNGSKKVHELTHTNEYPFACEWCGKRFRQTCRLKVHLEMHTTQPELLCPICKRSQKSAKDMEEHIKSHDDKRLQCISCGKLFKRGSHLKDHYNAVHLKLRPFKCEFCDFAFGDRKTRRVHEKSHTEERLITCSICKLGFKALSTYNKHKKETGHASEEFPKKTKTSKKNTVQLLNIMQYPGKFNSIFEL